ncbi:hypothetical protein JTB14_003681 [Gonioctena quinquepunctata]|nr:hypothetical protein JTB14_003681 [Gonioctena quinquepunctata]
MLSILHCSHFLYADDTKPFCNPLDELNRLQPDLALLEDWCKDWLIPLNPSKCTVFHIRRNNPDIGYHIGNVPIQQVKYQTDLGVTITKSMTWSEQNCKKANTTAHIVRKSHDARLFIQLHKSFIRPLVEFNVAVWSPNLIRDITLLENVQRKLTKWVLHLHQKEYHNRLTALNLPTLKKRRQRGYLIQCYRILTDTFSVDLGYILSLNVDERLRGHSLKLLKEIFRTSIRQHFITNRVIHEWNSLTDNIVLAPSINVFKNRLDNYYNSS